MAAPKMRYGEPLRTLREAAHQLYWKGFCNYRGLVQLRKQVASITQAEEMIRTAIERRGRSVPIGRPPVPDAQR
jgi:hypothetical protein